jgi:hypothetical protein
MTDFVWNQLKVEAKKIASQGLYDKASALRHMAKALCSRVAKMVNERKPAEAPAGSSYSLTVVDATDSWMKQNYGETVVTKARPKTLSRAAMEAAQGISLNHQVGNSSNLRLQ